MSYFLVGRRIGLRPLELSDADGAYPDWLNDAEVCTFNSHHVYPYDRVQARAYIESVRGSRSQLVLAVEEVEGKKHIGNVALQSIHPLYRSAEFSILLGDKSFWGQGVGEEAGRLLLGHAFDELGLHRVACGTTADNEGMKKLALKLGMREEGCRRAAAWKRGRWIDVVNFGVLVDEFRASEGA